MSSAATITFDPGTLGVSGLEWAQFCQEHAIKHSPQTIGGNVYYYSANVEIKYFESSLRFSTYLHGSTMKDVARLAMSAWTRWGGCLTADPEIRNRMNVMAITERASTTVGGESS